MLASGTALDGRMLLLSERAIVASPVPLITRSEARMLGITLRASTHVRLRRGIYAPKQAFLRLKPWQRYAARVHAFARSRPDAILCLESAAVLHGMPVFGHPRDIHVFDPDLRTSQRSGDVCVHTSTDPREIAVVAGVRVTSLLDTAADLARVLQPARALAVVDSAISPAQGGSVSVSGIMTRSRSQNGSRGRAMLRWVCERADPRAESPSESVSRAIIEWSGFEEPELQREFHYDGNDDRVDFHFRSTRVVGEADGWGKYHLDDADEAAERLRAEKRRENRLRRHGHPVARWELADAWKVDPLVGALRAAGLRPQHPMQPEMLASLSDRRRDRLPSQPSSPRETSVRARDGGQ